MFIIILLLILYNDINFLRKWVHQAQACEVDKSCIHIYIYIYVISNICMYTSWILGFPLIHLSPPKQKKEERNMCN